MNTHAERLTQAIRSAARDARPALLAFFTAGYPDRAGFARTLAGVAAAVAVVSTDGLVPDTVLSQLLENPAVKLARSVEFKS